MPANGASGHIASLAQHDTDVFESLLEARLENVVASGLDPRTHVAADAAPASYVFQVGLALEAGATADDILGVLIALNPTVGNVRIVAAAAEIAFALGIELDELADA
jgi:hypothetical protein